MWKHFKNLTTVDHLLSTGSADAEKFMALKVRQLRLTAFEHQTTHVSAHFALNGTYVLNVALSAHMQRADTTWMVLLQKSRIIYYKSDSFQRPRCLSLIICVMLSSTLTSTIWPDRLRRSVLASWYVHYYVIGTSSSTVYLIMNSTTSGSGFKRCSRCSRRLPENFFVTGCGLCRACRELDPAHFGRYAIGNIIQHKVWNGEAGDADLINFIRHHSEDITTVFNETTENHMFVFLFCYYLTVGVVRIVKSYILRCRNNVSSTSNIEYWNPVLTDIVTTLHCEPQKETI